MSHRDETLRALDRSPHFVQRPLAQRPLNVTGVHLMRASILTMCMLTVSLGTASAQFSAGTGNETNCSPGATNKGCNVSGTNKKVGPGTGNSTGGNAGTKGHQSSTTHSMQGTGSSRDGGEMGPAKQRQR